MPHSKELFNGELLLERASDLPLLNILLFIFVEPQTPESQGFYY
jgi:hypothetical protein